MGRRADGRLCAVSWVWMLFACLSWCSVGVCYKEKMRVGKFGRVDGGERATEFMSNRIGEPSCEELRAMWRYHKRQSRAELTNDIPAFDAPYWHLVPLQGFGPIKNLKVMSGRNRPRQHGSKSGPYGNMRYYGPTGAKSNERPLEKLKQSLPQKPPPANAPTQPIVQWNARPTSSQVPSSLQQLQKLYVQERPEKLPGQMLSDYGTVITSPPKGQNGRVASKPPMLMTPFEKLRFGHVQLEETSIPSARGVSKRGLFYYPIRATRLRGRQQATTTVSPQNPSLPHASIPSVFSFWRRQFLPQDPPPSVRMVDSLPPCPLVQGLQCTLSPQCHCSGHGLHCNDGLCQLQVQSQTTRLPNEILTSYLQSSQVL